MDSLKTVVDKAFDQIFKETQKSKLKVNEVEFALRNFSQIDRQEDSAAKQDGSKVRADRQERKEFGIILFDRLARLLKGMGYTMPGPSYQLIIRQETTDSDFSGGSRVILDGQDNIKKYCETSAWPAGASSARGPDLSEGQTRRESPIKFEEKYRAQTTFEDEIEKEYGVRLRMSQEETISGQGFNWAKDTTTAKVFRYRKRYSFQVPVADAKKGKAKAGEAKKGKDKEGEAKADEAGEVVFDLSVYKEGRGTSISNAIWPRELKPGQKFQNYLFLTGPETYDIELEYRPAADSRVRGPDLDRISQIILEPLYLSLQMKQDSPIVIPSSTEKTVYENYLRLVGYDPAETRGLFVGANVYPLKLDNLIGESKKNAGFYQTQHIAIDDYVFTLKADGTRNFLFIDETGAGYLIDMNHRVRSLGIQTDDKRLLKTLLDVEVISSRKDNRPPRHGNYRILAFDALFSNDRDIREQPLFPSDKQTDDYRFKALSATITAMSKLSSDYYLFDQKSYYRTPLMSNGKVPVVAPELENLDALVKLHHNLATIAYPTDGLILTHISRPYPKKVKKTKGPAGEAADAGEDAETVEAIEETETVEAIEETETVEAIEETETVEAIEETETTTGEEKGEEKKAQKGGGKARVTSAAEAKAGESKAGEAKAQDDAKLAEVAAAIGDRNFSFKVKNLSQLSVDFLYRSVNKIGSEMAGETQQLSLWVTPPEHNKCIKQVYPFHPIYREVEGANVATIPVIKQSESLQSISGDDIINTFMRTHEDQFLILNDFVYESVYKPDTGTWVPIRHRPIKTVQKSPNNFRTANSTWEMILNYIKNLPESITKSEVKIGEIMEDNLMKLAAIYLEKYAEIQQKMAVPIKPVTKGKSGGQKTETAKKLSPLTFEDYLLQNLKTPKFYFNSDLDSVWQQRYNEQPQIKTMNTMHNQIKGLLYQDTVMALEKLKLVEPFDPNDPKKRKLRLLELASGKGADYIRWQSSGFTEVVGIELDPVQINEANQRYQNTVACFRQYQKELRQFENGQRKTKPFPVSKPIERVQYIQADMTMDLNSGAAGIEFEDKQRLKSVLGQTPRFHVVACQFAIHFATGGEAIFKRFMRNVSQNLVAGGFFIGTSFIASRSEVEQKNKDIGPGVYDRLSKLEKEILTYKSEGGDIWSIQKGANFGTKGQQQFGTKGQQQFGTELKDFGQDIWVYLLSLHREPNREYLVNLIAERLINIAGEYNLQMVKLSGSQIGADGSPQAFGEVYSGLLSGAITPIKMGQIDVMAQLNELLANKHMAEFSRFHSLFVFQKLVKKS